MNWLEIDRWLVNLINATDDIEQIYKDAMKKFNWNRSQAESAIKPLQKRYSFQQVILEPSKKHSKPSTKRK